MKLFFAAIALAFVVLVVYVGPLSWDGGWILFSILDSGAPARYADRLISLPLHSVVLAAARLTDDLRVIMRVFSSIYAGMPVVGLTLSWCVVRRVNPRAFIWPALGIGLGTLPGQFNFLSDSIMALNLFWPVYVWILCSAPPSTLPVAVLLAIAMFFTHPVAVPLLALGAMAALLLGLRRRAVQRRMTVVAGAFGTAAAVKLALYFFARTTYDSSEASLSMQLEHFRTGVAGLPAIAVVGVWIAAVATFARPRASSPMATRVLTWTQWMAVLAAGGLLLVWASSPARWAYSLDFRNWALPAIAPILALAAVEALFSPAPTSETAIWRGRLRLAQAIALIFCAVLSLQSIVWNRLSVGLRASIASHEGGCVSLSDLRWPLSTALEHWATPAYAVLLQGRRANTLVLYRGTCGDTDFAHAMRFNHSFQVVRRSGWFILPDGIPKG